MPDIRLSNKECSEVKNLIVASQVYQDWAWSLPRPDGWSFAGWFKDRPERHLAIVMGRYHEWIAAWRRANPDVVRSTNKVLPKLKALHDTLTGGETTIFCEPLGERWMGKEEESAAFVKFLWKECDVDRESSRMLWDAHSQFGIGVVEIGWKFERGREKLNGERGEAIAPNDAQPFDVTAPDFGEAGIPDGMDAEAFIRQAEVEADNLYAGEPSYDAPFVERFSPRDLLVDPKARCWDLSDAEYAFRVRYEKAERVRRDKRYKNNKDVRGTYYIAPGDNRDVRPVEASSDDGNGLVKLYDGYMWRFMDSSPVEQLVHVILCDEHDKPLLERAMPYVDDDGEPLFPRSVFPFRVYAVDVTDNDCFYPQCPVEQAVHLQLAYDESNEALNDHRRCAQNVYLMKAGMLDADEIEAIKHAKERDVVEVEKFDQAKEFTRMPRDPIDQTIYDTLKMTDPEVERAFGITAQQESVTPQRKMTATEVHAQQSAGQTRIIGHQERFNAWRSDIATCLMLLFMKYGDRKWEFSHKSGGKEQWGTMDAEDMRGHKLNGELEKIGVQYRVKVTVDSEAHKNKLADQQLKLQWFQIVSKFFNISDPDDPAKKMVDMKKALKVVTDSLGIPNTEDIIAPPLTPEERQARMAQMAQTKQAGSPTLQQPTGGASAGQSVAPAVPLPRPAGLAGMGQGIPGG